MKSLQCSVFSVVTAGALAASAFGQGVKISQLPAATNVGTNDLVVIVQSNVTKKVPAGLLPGSGGGAATNYVGVLPITNGGTGATNAAGARAGLGLGPTNDVEFGSIAAGAFSSVGEIFVNESGQIYFDSPDAAARTRTNMLIPWDGMTNTNAAGWRAALELAPSATNTNVVVRDTNGVAQGAAWTLTTAPTNGVATIATNQYGVGWDELGRFSVNTPVGILSMYRSGDPSTPTIFWPGTLVANRISSVYMDTQVYASNIVGGAAGGAISGSVMEQSMPVILRSWQPSGAAAAGWPHVLTNAAVWPVAGTYFPVGVVSNFGSDNIAGQWVDPSAMRGLIGLPWAGLTNTNEAGLRSALGMATNSTVTFGAVVATNGTNVLSLPTTGTNGVMWSGGGLVKTTNVAGVPTGAAPLNAFLVADGAAGSTTRTNLPSLSIASGLITNSTQALSITQTWSNAAVTFIPLTIYISNATSASGSLFVDMTSDAGSSYFRVRRDGQVQVNRTSATVDAIAVAQGRISATAGNISSYSHTVMDNVGFNLSSDRSVLWSSTTSYGGTPDLYLRRDAAGALGLYDGTNAQQMRAYGTWVATNNYRRLSVGMSNNGIGYIRPEQAGASTNTNNFLYISGLPNTNTGLPSGVLWNSNGTVMVAP